MPLFLLTLILLPLSHFCIYHYRWFTAFYFLRRYPPNTKKPKKRSSKANANINVRQQRKPQWVIEYIIWLKAHMVHDGCRKIADAFNQIHDHTMTVSKSFVWGIINKHSHDILLLRKKNARKKPIHFDVNHIWSMDLTQVTDSSKHSHTLFGIIDAGSRACVCLRKVQTKASITLLRCFLDAVELYGKPVAIRTDNEPVFTSRLFCFCLKFLGIKHQRTHVCSPWQNGRIERFFGTLKRKLALYTIADENSLFQDLAIYRFWYNHVRTHQNLNGKTPADAWGKRKKRDKPMQFSVWESALTGIYFSPH